MPEIVGQRPRLVPAQVVVAEDRKRQDGSCPPRGDLLVPYLPIFCAISFSDQISAQTNEGWGPASAIAWTSARRASAFETLAFLGLVKRISP